MNWKSFYILFGLLSGFIPSINEAKDFESKYKSFVETHKKIDTAENLDETLKLELAKTCKKISVDYKDFLKWLLEQKVFTYDEKVLRRYLEPKRKKVSKISNKKNAKNVSKSKNLQNILDFIKANITHLESLEITYQVPKEVIASIYSHETRLGTFKLPHVLLDVLLSELIFMDEVAAMNEVINVKRIKRLKRLARYSLIYLYKYWDKDKIIYSSWAGACGPMQFMPFNFHYLKDGNGDNKIDPTNELDSIAGAYNFLKVKGWTEELSRTFELGVTNNKMHKVILRYNSSEEYASGILQTALRLQKLHGK
ncbi:MAG: lytic murein transglycosylase [Candidatus Cloacimonetes bacterium]|nr:lytic murein transglycosylase [Candidatus Cloacimonadota bacterium]